MDIHMYHGKRSDNGEWVSGYYIKADIHWNNRGTHEDWIVKSAILNNGYINLVMRYPVIHETVSRFTGKKDMNGDDLYENDLVYVYNSNCDEEDGAGRITWDNDESCYDIEFNGFNYRLGDCPICEIVKIGNAFDNKELIGGQ